MATFKSGSNRPTKLYRVAVRLGLVCWLGLAIIGWSLVSVRAAGSSTNLDNVDTSLVNIDKITGNPINPFAKLYITNKTNQNVTLMVQPGTLLRPTTETDKYYELLLVGKQLDVPPGKQSVLDLYGYQGALGNGGKQIAPATINFLPASYGEKASQTAAKVLSRANGKTPGDNAVQLGLWMALENLSFDDLTKRINVNIGEYRKEAQNYADAAAEPKVTPAVATTSVAVATTPAPGTTTGGASVITTDAAVTAPVDNGKGAKVDTLLIAIIGVLIVLMIVLVIIVWLVLRNAKNKAAEAAAAPNNGPPTPAPWPYAQNNQNGGYANGFVIPVSVVTVAPGGAKPNFSDTPPPFNRPNRYEEGNTEYVGQVTQTYSNSKGSKPPTETDEAGKNEPAYQPTQKDMRAAEQPEGETDLFDRNRRGAQDKGPEDKGQVLLQPEKSPEYEEALKKTGKTGFAIDERKPRLILSRGRINLLCLDEPSISSPHAILEFRYPGDELRIFITDLFSRNGTFVLNYPKNNADLLRTNGRLIPEKQRDFELFPDENGRVRLRFGLANFTYYYRERRLVMDGPGGRPTSFDLRSQKRWVIARGQIEVLELNVKHKDERLYDGDTLISTPHALIELDGLRFKLRDLNSRNGVYLENNQRVRGSEPQILNLGDQFKLGQNTAFRLRDPRRRLEDIKDALPGYIVEAKPLASGGMGLVYRCRQAKTGKDFALKLPHPEKFLNKGQYLAAWQQEQAALQKLDPDDATDKGIVSIRDFGIIQQLGVPYYLMDFINGVTLREIMAHSALLNQEQTIYIITKLMTALKSVHANAGLVHCDVTSGNVMIDREGKVWLTDFGIATPIDAPAPPFLNKNFAAPELSKGEKVTRATDIFSIGMLIYHLSENKQGTPPEIADEPDTKVLYRKSKTQLDPVTAQVEPQDAANNSQQPTAGLEQPGIVDGFPPAGTGNLRLKDIRRRCLRIAPNERYQTVELVEAEFIKAGLYNRTAIEATRPVIQGLVRSTLSILNRL